ncbi:MAG: KEOPS complex subunit Pcc1 [Nitrososphaeria archaeon]|jgi:tRNA threonylcarbamoyladenosine modification (KEOPS) complex  Pcc1 subunit
MNRITLNLTFESENKKIVSAIFNALKPDNVNVPKEVSFNFDFIGNKIVLIVSSEEGYETLISTVREVLDSIGLCVQALMVGNDGKNKN